VQLEINRALSLDEASLSKSKDFAQLASTLARLAAQVFQALPALLERRAAAE
jgi:N-formylglutamate amidohydrolase